MKDPSKLQEKLREVLKRHSNLKLCFEDHPSREVLKDIAWVVQDFVNNSGDVTNDDPLHEWLEEYYFFSQERVPHTPQVVAEEP